MIIVNNKGKTGIAFKLRARSITQKRISRKVVVLTTPADFEREEKQLKIWWDAGAFDSLEKAFV